MTPQDYDFIRKVLKERSGLVLGPDKQYLLESRLLPVVRKGGFGDLTGLIAALRAAPSSPLVNTVVEGMTTNESLFFRDKLPFDNFREVVMPALLEARKRTKFIRIWCAAAATGQEPYSLAMALKEMSVKLSGWRVEILATDLSSDALETGQGGPIQPVRGAARPADSDAGQVFQQGRRAVADRAGNPRHGHVPPLQSVARLLELRPVRRGVLPQRADLFRARHEKLGAQPAGPVGRKRRLFAARRRRDGGRAVGRLPSAE